MELGDNSAHSKEQRLAEQFRGEFPELFALDPITRPISNFDSRARVKLTVSGTAETPLIGLLDQQFKGIELLDCPLHFPELNKLLHFLKSLISKERLHPYDVVTKTGELKGLSILSNNECSEIILRFVLRSRSLEKRISRTIPEIQQAFPAVKVVSINLQPIAHAISEGPEELILTEQTEISEQYLGRKFVIAPQSFVQVSPSVAEALYARAAEFAHGRKSFLDLFCGIGGFSIFLAKEIQLGIGVELSEQAIRCAKQAALLNSSQNLEFVAADVLTFLKAYSGEHPELIVVNPPRRGLSEEIITEITRLGPEQILYSSCNPKTLINDLRTLSKDYKLERVAPFDMFPLTEHLEVLVSLTRR